MDKKTVSREKVIDHTELPDEIIAEAYKKGDNFHAKIQGTDTDITELINNTPKLKYAYKHLVLIKGKKDRYGNYKWRAK